MRRLRSLGQVIAGCLFLLVMPGLAPQAVAQNIFNDVFGWLTQSEPAPKAPEQDNPFARSEDAGQPQPDYSGRRYRTVCVRLCDGYYFPISQATSRRNFYRDAEQCTARCGGNTRLFYVRPDAPDMKTARDVSGLVYSGLANAFAYRKRLVKGCACRPAPWSAAERARHQMYSTAEPVVALTPSTGDSPLSSRSERLSKFDANVLSERWASGRVPGRLFDPTKRPPMFRERRVKAGDGFDGNPRHLNGSAG